MRSTSDYLPFIVRTSQENTAGASTPARCKLVTFFFVDDIQERFASGESADIFLEHFNHAGK